ncbi:hypothetical protein MLD52_17295 [Puniceicoccaceae bacterium K14]|nr:hypothetical protein [Puniceicoccaceae bacterium K14]
MYLFVSSGLIYVSGAIGFELIAGKYDEQFGEETLMYSFLYTCEELLEMFGVALFIYALLVYIVDHVEQMTIEFVGS